MVYIITGIKIAYGASAVITHSKNNNINLHLGVDATNLGVPVSGGPHFGIRRESGLRESIGNASPFVLAFRLRQIKVTAKGDIEDKPLTHGALLSIGSRTDDGVKPEELIVDGLEEDDADADEFDIESNWDVMDDSAAPGELSACAMSLEA